MTQIADAGDYKLTVIDMADDHFAVCAVNEYHEAAKNLGLSDDETCEDILSLLAEIRPGRRHTGSAAGGWTIVTVR